MGNAAHTSHTTAGAYRVRLLPSASGCECTTSATFHLAVDRDGFAASTDGVPELDASSHQVASFDPGPCFVSSAGDFRCVLGYSAAFVSPPDDFFLPPSDLGLTGDLPSDGGVAFGTAEPAIFSSYFGGDIRIERAPE